MRRLMVVTVIVGVVAGLSTVATAAKFPRLSGDYRFVGSLGAANGHHGPLVDLTGSNAPNRYKTTTVHGLQRRVRVFAKGNGFALPSATDFLARHGGSYSILMQVKLDTVDQWTRLIEFGDGTRDAGLYVAPDNRLAFPPYAPEGTDTIAAGKWTDVEITRAGSNGTIAVYLDGKPQFTTSDAAQNGVVDSSNVVHFFQDNTSGGSTGQESSGSIGRIKLYRGPISAKDLTRFQLDVPAPEAFSNTPIVYPGDVDLMAVYSYGFKEPLSFFFTDADSTRTLVKTIKSTTDGFISTVIDIPAGAALGPATIEVDGANSRYDETATVTVKQPSRSG